MNKNDIINNMMEIHRNIKKIPAKRADDPNLYEQEQHPTDYDFVRTPEKRAFSWARKRAYQNNATQQITHFDGKHTHIIEVTLAQAKCYNVVKSKCQKNMFKKGIKYSTLRSLFRHATINVLIKKNLLTVVVGIVLIGTHIESNQEIMEKGGVGKISITMPG